MCRGSLSGEKFCLNFHMASRPNDARLNSSKIELLEVIFAIGEDKADWVAKRRIKTQHAHSVDSKPSVPAVTSVQKQSKSQKVSASS